MQFKLIIISEGLVHVTLDLRVTLCETLEVMTQETSIVKVKGFLMTSNPKFMLNFQACCMIEKFSRLTIEPLMSLIIILNHPTKELKNLRYICTLFNNIGHVSDVIWSQK